MDLDEAAGAFQEFVAVVQALRTPVTGCPWDLEQDHRTLRRYLIEETYEVLDAIDGEDDRSFQDELGDLLLQVALHAQVADDRHAFSITEVVRGITEKMRRRHPHVFGSQRVRDAAEVVRNWEQIKAAEKQERGDAPSRASALGRIPEGLPALLRAQRLCEMAARAQVDEGSLAGIRTELGRAFVALEEEIDRGLAPSGTRTTDPDPRQGQVEQRLGDVLFSLCQLARVLDLNAEDSLRVAARRFSDRFQRMAQQAPRLLNEPSKEGQEDAP